MPLGHLGDMRALFDGIPLDRDEHVDDDQRAGGLAARALSSAVAEEQGVERAKLQGTTQNDIIKEYLSRGTYIFPPEPSLRLTADTIGFTYREVPKWNPMNVCSYHLQEAGRDAGAGAGLRAGQRHRRARCGAGDAARCPRPTSRRWSGASPSS